MNYGAFISYSSSTRLCSCCTGCYKNTTSCSTHVINIILIKFNLKLAFRCQSKLSGACSKRSLLIYNRSIPCIKDLYLAVMGSITGRINSTAQMEVTWDVTHDAQTVNGYTHFVLTALFIKMITRFLTYS